MRPKEDLGLSKVSEFLGGFSSANASLSAAQVLEQAFRLQVILRQAGDVITGQQLWLVQPPAFSQSREQQALGPLCSWIGVERVDQHFHIGGNLLAAEVTIAMCRAVGRIVETVGDLQQPLMSFGQVGCVLPVILEGTLHLEQ